MSEQSLNQKSSRRFYFSLATLFVAVACLSVIFAGFRVGYNRGYSAGQNQRLADSLYTVMYPVGDIVGLDFNGQLNFDSLRDVLNLIDPDTWDDVGGPGQIRIFESNQSFAILQTADVHKTIGQILQAIRDGRKAATVETE